MFHDAGSPVADFLEVARKVRRVSWRSAMSNLTWGESKSRGEPPAIERFALSSITDATARRE
jgi:hypothetical protein